MALTELQLPDKNSFYVKLQDLATRMRKHMAEWEATAEFIASMDTADLDAMGVATGDVRTDLINFRSALVNILSLWEGNAVEAPTVSPFDAVNKIRFMS